MKFAATLDDNRQKHVKLFLILSWTLDNEFQVYPLHGTEEVRHSHVRYALEHS